jgi:hypothetical protein
MSLENLTINSCFDEEEEKRANANKPTKKELEDAEKVPELSKKKKKIYKHMFVKDEEVTGITKELTDKEMDKIDPESGLTWRELVYGVSKETLKDVAKGKELKNGENTVYEKGFHKKKEKKEVSKKEALKIIENYHKTVMKVRRFLVPFAKKYFPDSSQDIAGAQMELIAIQTLMRSQESASVDAIRTILKEKEDYIEIGGERKKLSDVLFLIKSEETDEAEDTEAVPIFHGTMEKDKKEETKRISISPNINIVTKNQKFIDFLEQKSGNNEEVIKKEEDDTASVSHGTSEKENDKGVVSVPEKMKNTEKSTDEALKTIRDYFDLQAKIYGMFDEDRGKLFPKLGEQVEENRLAIIAIESYLHLHDKTSLRAVQRILEDEKKYIKENKQTPLAGLFLQIKPHIKAILDTSDK